MQAPNPNTWNEQDVREIVIRPLLDKLGYAKDSQNDILTGYCLNHPYAKYGRKEIPVKAFSDYILDVQGRRWVLEAKPPVPITDDDVDQSYSYAAHYEVRGLYFAISNGLELRVYITQNYRRGINPDKVFLFEDIRQEVAGASSAIAFVLGPAGIQREYPRPPIIENAIPLAAALRSSARIKLGQIIFTEAHALLQQIESLIVTVLTGSVTRSNEGNIVAILETCVPNARLQEFNRIFGLDKMTLTASGSAISSNIAAPTILNGEREVLFAAGTVLPSLYNAPPIRLPSNVKVNVKTKASGTLMNQTFTGSFAADYAMSGGPLIGLLLGNTPLNVNGTFTVELE
jgi:hypothetical protein